MCKHKSMITSLSSKLVLKVKHQYDDASCCWVCHRRFHGFLPKEHSGAFYEVPWGLYKEMSNTQGQSDIVNHKQISEIKNIETAANGLLSTVAMFQI
jgi:hypothetical protein